METKPKLILEIESELEKTINLCQFNEISEVNTQDFGRYSVNEFGKIIGLNISNLKLLFLPRSLYEFETLIELNISKNYLVDINPMMKTANLQSLKTLHASDNLINDITYIGSLVNLNILNLGGNVIEDISEIGLLLDLKGLILDSNKISNIAPLHSLMKLKSLDLENNYISHLPEWVCELNIEIQLDNKLNTKCMNIKGNPIKNVPPEILTKGISAIKQFFDQSKKEGTQKLFEAKVMLVGYGLVGKTSIIKKMLYNEFDEHEKITIGIQVDNWKFTHESENDFRINVWDFGGQEVNYPTHQFFLTKRSIYVKVWEHRQYSNLPNLAFFDYWLNVAKLYGDQSPIIVVQNKIDERYMGLPQQELQEVFGVHRFIDVSAKEGTGINDLKNLIERLVIELPHTGQNVPRSWFEIRRELEQHDENFISIYEYFEICKKHGLDRDKALYLSDFFHDLGVFLHFKHTPLLHDLIFLKSDWTTNVVYQIMHNVKVQRAYGKFHYQILSEIWTDYPEERYPHFLALMQKFQMCLPLENNEFLVPELLAADPPKYDWDYKENVRFEFSYKFMPAGLMTQFIWRLFDLLEVYWKSGAVITYKETRLLVRIFIVERKVSFWLKGKNTEETLNLVRWEFDKIHRYLQNPMYKEMFPCNCSECTNSSDPAFYEYTQLKKILEKNRKEISCPQSAELVLINPLLGKYNGGSAKTPLFEYIFRAAKKLQGLQKPLILGLQENNRNTFIANELSNSDYIIKYQALWGQSTSGKQAGEMDIKIENKNRETIAIIEAFNLKSFVQKTVSTHIDKLINSYDLNGLPENYILVYCENNFEENWGKYIQFVSNLKMDSGLTQFEPHYSSGVEVADIKTAKAIHLRNGSEIVIYHFFVKISSQPI